VNKQLWTIIGTAGVSLAVGGAAGFLIAQRRLQTVYDAILAEEIKATKDFYSRLHKTEFDSPQAAAEFFGLKDVNVVAEEDEAELYEAVRQYRSKNDIEIKTEVDPEVAESLQNVFTEHGDNWDLEKQSRSEDEPYILHVDEFMQNDGDHTQVELTYYEVDGILADEREEHMDDPEKFIGDGQLLKFGYQSEDPNVVYIRNELLAMDFCIKKNTGSYKKQVLGFDDPPKRNGGRRR
jgi:hypothetical protein